MGSAVQKPIYNPVADGAGSGSRAGAATTTAAQTQIPGLGEILLAILLQRKGLAGPSTEGRPKVRWHPGGTV